MKHRQKIFISAIITTLFVLTTVAFYLAKKKLALPQFNDNQPQSVSALSVTLKANPPTVKLGNKVSIDVLIEGNFADSVSAADLKLSYPAEILKPIDSRAGNIWTKAVKLKQEVNPETGIVNLSVGRGIDAKTAVSPILANFDFQVVSSSSAEIKLELDKSSRFARLGGGNQPVSYQTSLLVIKIN